jgi:hypothetical protein
VGRIISLQNVNGAIPAFQAISQSAGILFYSESAYLTVNDPLI